MLAHRCRVTGIDQSPAMLAAAAGPVWRSRAWPSGSRSCRARPSACPSRTRAFDALTVTYLLRYVDDPAATLRELARVVRPGGTLASMEFGVPPWAPARARVAALHRGAAAGGRAGGGRAALVARRALPAPAASPDLYDRHPLPALLDLYRAAGLEDLRVRRLSFGGGVVIWGARPTAP